MLQHLQDQRKIGEIFFIKNSLDVTMSLDHVFYKISKKLMILNPSLPIHIVCVRFRSQMLVSCPLVRLMGNVLVEDVMAAVRSNTCLVTLMHANNETGILQVDTILTTYKNVISYIVFAI